MDEAEVSCSHAILAEDAASGEPDEVEPDVTNSRVIRDLNEGALVRPIKTELQVYRVCVERVERLVVLREVGEHPRV